MSHALLLTGPPGIGKTTVVRRVLESVTQRAACGFFTDELRVSGRRTGFRITTLDGDTAVLAALDLRSPHRVGRYRVDVTAIDRIVDRVLRPTDRHQLVIIDEIGKMECLSSAFETAVRSLLADRQPLLATVAERGSGLIEEVKRHRDAELWQITVDNRDRMPARVVAWIEQQRGVTR